MREQLRRLRDVDPILIQAVIAAAISFSHIHDVAAAAGQTGWKAWAYPVSVDLLLVMAWKLIRAARGTGKRAAGPWVWFVLSLAASLGANVATAGVLDLSTPPTSLRVAVAGWPVLAFFGGSLLIHGRKRQAEDAPATEEPPVEPQLPAVAPEVEPVEEVPPAPLQGLETPVLRSYAEVAETLGVAVETVRGWASQGHISKYTGHTPGAVRVDLRECTKRFHSIRRPVGA